MKIFVRAIALAGFIVVPACRIPELRPPQSGPTIPDQFPAAEKKGEGKADESSAKLTLEEFYNDPKLTELISLALANNQELRVLEQEVQIAQNEVLARRGSYLPFVTIGGGGGVERTSIFTRNGAVEEQLEIIPGRRFPNPLPNSRLGLNLNWELDVWHALRDSRDAAALRYLSTIDRRNFVATRIIAEIAETYYELVSLDQRIITLDLTIELQKKSLEQSKAKKDAAKGTELAVQRFQAEVSKNESEKMILLQEIIEAENKINVLANRYPQKIDRNSAAFFDLKLTAIQMGLPSQLLQNRGDIRQAERELAATGLDLNVARAAFYPRFGIDLGVGYEAFNPRYLFDPGSFAAGVGGNIVAPLINKKAIQADYMTANAKQLQSLYTYQQTILNAYTEVVNRIAMVENYGKSIELKKQQLKSLQESVDSANNLFLNARAEYIEVLFAQRDLMDARMDLIDTKRQQLAATVQAYQALGGGTNALAKPAVMSP